MATETFTKEEYSDALTQAIEEDAAFAASEDASINGGLPTSDAPKPVSLAEMQARGNKIYVGDKVYHVSPLLFGRLAELHGLSNELPHILFAAALAEPDEPGTLGDVDGATVLSIMRGITKDPGYSDADARRDFRELGFRLTDRGVLNTIADIILMGVEAKHPDATPADFLSYLSVPSCIAVIRAVWGGAVGDFFAPA